MPLTAAPMQSDPHRPSRSVRWGLLAFGLVFLLWRVPVMYLSPGGQDEDFYAVPGLTILEDGIPRLPHVPSRNLESAFYRADEILYSEPPLYFYYQALFYSVLPDVYGTGRLASGIAGLVLMVLLARLARGDSADPSAVLWGVGLFALSRWFYFPAISARPDLLCTGLGIAAILAVRRWETTSRKRWLVAAGLLIGAGGLTHPFAIVYAVQIGGWVAIVARRSQRLTLPAIVATSALLTASLWLILIAQAPETFRIQFRNQFLTGTEESLLSRLVWPWESLQYHFSGLWEHIGWFQCSLAIAGWIACGVIGWRERRPAMLRLWWLIVSGAWLLSALVGSHHPVFGYWSYPAALTFVGLGAGIGRFLAAISRRTSGESPRRVIPAMAGCLIVGAMIPGAGLRTLIEAVRHSGDVNYNAPAFAAALLDEIPADAVCIVDTELTLDFVAAGRTTLLELNVPKYFEAGLYDYDFLIVSRRGLPLEFDRQLNARLIETRGVKDDPFACYVEIYVPK